MRIQYWTVKYSEPSTGEKAAGIIWLLLCLRVALW